MVTSDHRTAHYKRARQYSLENKKMKKMVLILTALLAFGATAAHADEATEQAIIKTIMDGNAYVKKNLRGMVPEILSAIPLCEKRHLKNAARAAVACGWKTPSARASMSA